MSTMVGEVFPLSPGVLKIGATGSEIDISCLVNNATISADKDEGDSVTKLCGTVRPGAVSYTYHLTGNVDTDIGDDSGLFALSQDNPGAEFDFEFTPNADAGTTAKGKLVVDPLDFGGDTTGETMTSDFDYTIVGVPVYSGYGVPVTIPLTGNNGESAREREAEPVG